MKRVSIVRQLLKTQKDNHTIRAVTRDASKPASKALESLDVALAEVDLNDKASLERAFKGANVIFGVTDFFSSNDLAIELQQGKNIIDAAIDAAYNTLDRFFWSTLPELRAFKVPYQNCLHFNGKNDIRNYLKTTILSSKTTQTWVGPYMQNFTKFAAVYL